MVKENHQACTCSTNINGTNIFIVNFQITFSKKNSENILHLFKCKLTCNK